MREKSPKGRKVMYICFAVTIAYLSWCVIVGMGVALYESSPSADTPRTRATFNQCMRQIVMLSDEATHSMQRAEREGSKSWVTWEKELYSPGFRAIEKGCNQFLDMGIKAALDSLQEKVNKARTTAQTFSGDVQNALPDPIRETTRLGTTVP